MAMTRPCMLASMSTMLLFSTTTNILMYCYAYFSLATAAAASYRNLDCIAFAPPLRVADTPLLRFQRSPLSHIVGSSAQRILTLQAPPPPFPADRRRQRDGRTNRSPILYSLPISDQDREPMQYYIRPYLKQLFLLCRPVNFPIVALFHMLGVHQAAQLWKSTLVSPASSSLLLPLLKHPSMLMVLLSLLLVTSTSMITNDYYDARNGVDSTTTTSNHNNENEHYHPLAQGEVPFSVTKTFDSYLYAILLLSSAFVPGVLSRLMVLGGAITTYLYTVHLKPRTWVKNLSCAALVAMSPVTSGLAAWHVLCGGAFLKSLGAGVSTVGAGGITIIPFHLIFKSPLLFLVVALFAGIMSREILMDITDCEGDAQAGIETVPVRYGKSVASRVALGCSLVSAMSACGASLIPWVTTFAVGGEYLRHLITVLPTISSLSTLLINSQARKVMLAVAGSGMLLWRTFSVWKTNGEDANLCERAIRESLISVLLVLASFL